jgi:hypothetical protein
LQPARRPERAANSINNYIERRNHMTQQREHDPAVSPEAEEEQPSAPEIWVGSAEDYSGERRYGQWINAAAEPKELVTRIRTILETTPEAGSQTWGIYDLRGFGGWEPETTQGLPTVAMVARGVAAHGLAYSALVKVVGADSLAAQPERFRLSFVGEWPSLDDFAITVIEESGWNERLDRLPDNLRRYVRIDTKLLIRDAKRELAVVAHDAGIWVFDPRNW